MVEGRYNYLERSGVVIENPPLIITKLKVDGKDVTNPNFPYGVSHPITPNLLEYLVYKTLGVTPLHIDEFMKKHKIEVDAKGNNNYVFKWINGEWKYYEKIKEARNKENLKELV